MARPSLQVPRILWFALLMSLGIYGFVLTQAPVPAEAAQPPLPALVLWPLSCVLVLLSTIVVPIWGRTLQRQAVLNNRAHPEQAALGAYQTTLIMRLALAEAVALLGFVNAFAAGSVLVYAPSGALAALVMLWHFPTESRALGR